jgi:adenylate kinase
MKTIFNTLIYLFITSFFLASSAIAETDEANGQSAESEQLVIVIIGPPGAGKTTQANFISKEMNVPVVSTGELLRQEIANETDIGKQVREKLRKSELVSDDIVVALLQKETAKEEFKNGFVIDGFPRTLDQAKKLDEMNYNIKYIFNLYVPNDVSLERLTNRRYHKESGREYNLISSPPKVAGKDDVTGEPLMQRESDKPKNVFKRLNDYHTVSFPITVWYENNAPSMNIKYIEIDGTPDIETVSKSIKSHLDGNS